MSTHQAKPEPNPRDRESRESAGPASSRLIMEEVSFNLTPRGGVVRVELGLGPQRFTGNVTARGGQSNWELATAATVEAIQQYLQQCSPAASLPQVQLLTTALATLKSGQEIVHTVVSFTDGDRNQCLLGSALVRNDRCTTAVAAVLDATSRSLETYRLRGDALKPQKVEESERYVEEETPLASDKEIYPGPTAPDEFDIIAIPPPSLLEAPPETVTPPFPEIPTPPIQEAPVGSVLGIGFGTEAVGVVVLNPEGKPVAQVQRAAHLADPEMAIRAALGAAQEAITQLNSHATQLQAVALAVPGTLHSLEGICVSCPEFPLWKDVQLVQPLAEELQLPVELVGMTQAAAVAEVKFGAAQGLTDVLFVRVGINIDAVMLTDGKLLPLAQSLGGEVGHLLVEAEGGPCTCGNSGCWVALAGHDALVRRVIEAVEESAKATLGLANNGWHSSITPTAICKAAGAGNSVARAALEETGHYLALGLGNLITIFNPEAVILDSAPPGVGAALRRAVENALKNSPRASRFSRCVLLSPELSEAGALGAAAWRQQLLRS